MSASKQPGAEEAAAAPRHSFAPVPAPRTRGLKLKKPVLCPAPCCVQARGGERPLGPDVPQLVPVDAEQAEEERGGELSPPLPNLGHLRRGRRRKRREEERKIKERLREIERLRIESESTSSEEEICQEMEMVTLDKMTKTRDCNGAVYNSTARVENPVCETIQISGQLHIQHLPWYDHHDDQDDGFNIHDDQGDDSDMTDDLDDDSERDFKAEDNIKLEELQPEGDYDATEFDTDQDDAAEADHDQGDEEEDETGDYDAVEAECLEPADEAIEGCEGYEEFSEEEAEAHDVLEETPEDAEDEEHDEDEGDDNDYEEGYCFDYDYYECDDSNNYDSCNDCDYDS